MLARVEVLVEGVGRVDGLVLLRGIFPRVLEDDLLAARVVRKEVGDVVGARVHDDPAGFAAVVFGHFFAREFHGLRVGAVVVHCGGLLGVGEVGWWSRVLASGEE